MAPTKKYSVFVSSTYEDLKLERQTVYLEILRLGAIPIGMESFTASTVQQLDDIKSLIDACDYFIVFSAARYGSIHPELKKSFTHLELEYAEEKKIPVLRFVHGNIDALANSLHEVTSRGKEQLKSFHQQLRGAGFNCPTFSSAAELGMQVTPALVKAFADSPRTGWIRGNSSISSTNTIEGIWQLLPDPNRGDDQARMVTDGIRRLKFYSGENYVGVWHDLATGRVEFCHGGKYTRDGRNYVEQCVFSNRQDICPIGTIGRFDLLLADPYLDLNGVSGLNEHWRRVSDIHNVARSYTPTSTTAAPKLSNA